MSTLQTELILEQLNTQLQALVPGTVASIARNFPYSFNAILLPAIQITMGSDTPVEPMPNNMTWQDWKLQVHFDIVIKSATTPLDTQLNAIRLAVHQNIMANYTLGLSYVLNAYPSAVSAPEQKSEGEEPVSVMRVEFTFEHRTSITNPSN